MGPETAKTVKALMPGITLLDNPDVEPDEYGTVLTNQKAAGFCAGYMDKDCALREGFHDGYMAKQAVLGLPSKKQMTGLSDQMTGVGSDLSNVSDTLGETNKLISAVGRAGSIGSGAGIGGIAGGALGAGTGAVGALIYNKLNKSPNKRAWLAYVIGMTAGGIAGGTAGAGYGANVAGKYFDKALEDPEKFTAGSKETDVNT